MTSSLASVPNNPLSIDRVKLNEKLQTVSPVDRLLIPEQFSDLALSYLNKNTPNITDTDSQLVSNENNNLNHSINGVDKKTDKSLTHNEDKMQISQNIAMDLVPQDFIIPSSNESTAVIMGHERRTEMKIEYETTHKETKLTGTPSGLEQVEELEDWLNDLI